jgi:hypothetical protein
MSNYIICIDCNKQSSTCDVEFKKMGYIYCAFCRSTNLFKINEMNNNNKKVNIFELKNDVIIIDEHNIHGTKKENIIFLLDK